MKWNLSAATRRISGIVIVICLLVLAVVNVIGYFCNCRYISVLAAVEEVNVYEVKSQLLMDAMSHVGVCNPEAVADVWANGLIGRSAALQYAVMSQNLKDEYAKQLDMNTPNWVTGVSSPWVDHYKIVRSVALDKGQYMIELILSTATSTGPYEDYGAMLTVSKEGDFWRITDLSYDEQLFPYTGFDPRG